MIENYKKAITKGPLLFVLGLYMVLIETVSSAIFLKAYPERFIENYLPIFFIIGLVLFMSTVFFTALFYFNDDLSVEEGKIMLFLSAPFILLKSISCMPCLISALFKVIIFLALSYGGIFLGKTISTLVKSGLTDTLDSDAGQETMLLLQIGVRKLIMAIVLAIVIGVAKTLSDFAVMSFGIDPGFITVKLLALKAAVVIPTIATFFILYSFLDKGMEKREAVNTTIFSTIIFSVAYFPCLKCIMMSMMLWVGITIPAIIGAIVGLFFGKIIVDRVNYQ